jgi:UDP-N-acetylglucosamine acyltransferase
MISGGSLVRKDVPPYVKAGREPLSYVGINSVGLRRRGFSDEKINEIQDIYRTIFLRKYNITQAIDIIEAEVRPTEERDEIINFIRNSNRGIMKGFLQ